MSRELLYTVFQDASQLKPGAIRWFCMRVSTKGSLIGLTLHKEFSSMGDVVRWICHEFGAEPGDIQRVFIPRFDGKAGWYDISIRWFTLEHRWERAEKQRQKAEEFARIAMENTGGEGVHNEEQMRAAALREWRK